MEVGELRSILYLTNAFITTHPTTVRFGPTGTAAAYSRGNGNGPVSIRSRDLLFARRACLPLLIFMCGGMEDEPFNCGILRAI